MKNSDPTFFPGTEFESNLKQTMQKRYSDSINILQTQWLEADLDQRYCMGDQELWGILYPDVTTNRRKTVSFNLINPKVQVVSGHQRRTRKSSVCIPTKGGANNQLAQKTADQITKCLYYVHNKSNAYQVYSDAFEQGALVQGIGLINIIKDNITDDISLRYVDFKSVLIDPYLRKADLSDCNWIWTRQFFDKQEAKLIYKDYADFIDTLQGGYQDDKFYFMPEVYQIQFPNLVAFDEYWYRTTREAIFLRDKQTGETKEFFGDEEDLRVVKMEMGDRIKIIKGTKPTVRRAILANNRLMIDEENPLGLDTYPYVLSLGYFTADTEYYKYKYRGIVRDLRDVSFLFTRRKVADLDILESQQQGIKMKKGALATPLDALNTGNGRALILNKEASMDDVQAMEIHPPSPVMLEMENMLKDLMMEISGINEELLGSATDEKAGILSMLRQGAGLTSLQRLFDQCDETQRQVSNLIVEIIQKNWSYNKVREVLGEEPTEQFDNKAFFDYSCKVIPAVLTETQQQLELAQLLNLAEIMASNPPPPVLERIIDTMYIQNKEELKTAMQKFNEQNAQNAQRMQELQMEQIKVDNATKISYAHAQEARSSEQISKIQTDKAVAIEKLARSKTEEMESLANLLKALKELKGMDIENLGNQIEMLHRINDLDFRDQTEREKAEEVAAAI